MVHTFGLHLEMTGRDLDVSALAELSLAEERLTAMQHHRKDSAATSTGAAGGQSMQQEHIPAFLARIRFRRALLKV